MTEGDDEADPAVPFIIEFESLLSVLNSSKEPFLSSLTSPLV